MSDLVKRLRDKGRRTSELSHHLAEEKTRRNREAGDPHADYRGVLAVDTDEWRAADALEEAEKALEGLYDAVKHLRANRDIDPDFCAARDAARAALAKIRGK